MKNEKYLFFTIVFLSLGLTTLFAKTLRIMPLGDSITNGITMDPDPKDKRIGYRAPLYKQLIDAKFDVNFVGSLKTGSAVRPAFDIDNEGHPGWTSFDLTEKIFDYLSTAQPDIILLHVGTNDRTTSINGVRYLLDEIDHYENSSGHKIRIIIAKIINRREYDPVIAAFNKRLGNLVIERWKHGDILTLFDMDTDAALSENDYVNNTHPNNNGYAKMARVWFNELNKPYIKYTSAPLAKSDKVETQTGKIITINVTANDEDLQNDMNISTVSFTGGTDSDGDGDNDKLTVSAEGKWSVDEQGLVTFVPNSNFTADPTPITYTVKDEKRKESSPVTITIDYTNASLEIFPTSLVNQSYIESISINEAANSIEFITKVPNAGIKF